jgi:hypothetical protein
MATVFDQFHGQFQLVTFDKLAMMSVQEFQDCKG